MPGPLTHSTAQIVAEMLAVLGLGSRPSSGDEWPVHHAGEPDMPDKCITITDTQGRDSGRVMQGERAEHHGFQVRIRAGTHAVGYAKARAIAVSLDTDVYQETVTLGANSYLVHSVTRTSDVLALGKETPQSKRSIFTLNGLVSVRQE